MESNNELPKDINEAREELAFLNPQIEVDTLPRIGEIHYEKIQKNSFYVDLIVLAIISLIVIIGAIFLVIFNETVRHYYFYLFSAIIVILSFMYLVDIKGFKHIGFALRSHDIIYKHGWLWRSIVAIPFNRIQHIEVHQGPIDRIFDLSSITLYTAGGSDVEIEGLSPEQAESIKAYIMSKNQDLQKDQIDDESE
jgi:uncharacterized protein